MKKFGSMELIKENVKVAWEYIGEGINGDYNEEDEHDEQLLRFEVMLKNNSTNNWEYIEDSSYCTNFPLKTSYETKLKGLEVIMDLVFDEVQSGKSIKKLCERLSHIDDTLEMIQIQTNN